MSTAWEALVPAFLQPGQVPVQGWAEEAAEIRARGGEVLGDVVGTRLSPLFPFVENKIVVVDGYVYEPIVPLHPMLRLAATGVIVWLLVRTK